MAQGSDKSKLVLAVVILAIAGVVIAYQFMGSGGAPETVTITDPATGQALTPEQKAVMEKNPNAKPSTSGDTSKDDNMLADPEGGSGGG